MEHFKYFFVILVYRNTTDLEECLISIKAKVSSYKSIVVNAYYDEASKLEVERIASIYQCDFINIENKGYSYGNNQGIEYARSHYEFEYIVVSNPDIIIEKFDDSFMDSTAKYDIIAPRIIAASGKPQNPAAVCRSLCSEFLIYVGYKYSSKLLLFCGVLLSKIIREFTLLIMCVLKKHSYRIYCAHASFVLLSKKVTEELDPVYDEKVFLFGEEGILAQKAKKANLRTYYVDYISINHKEDGSMKMSDLSINGEMRSSNIYYYENYVKKNG